MVEMNINIKIDENKLFNLILEGKENFIISNFLKLKQLGIIS